MDHDESLRLKQQAAALWEQDRARLYLRFPFLASLASRLEMRAVIDERVPTAGTDGRAVYANALLLLHLNTQQRAVLLAHEVWHVALNHEGRRGPRDAERWHRAADHEVNHLLRSCGMSTPANAVVYQDAPSDQAEGVYAWLAATEKNNDSPPRAPQKLSAQNLPSHWNIPDFSDALASQRDPDVQLSQPALGGQATLRSALQQHPGQLPGQVQQFIDQLLPPRVPWQRLLSQALQPCLGGGASWSPPSRRSAWSGIHLPSRRTRHLQVAVAMDTSASTAEEAAQWWGELRAILNCSQRWSARLFQCDSAIQADHRIDDRQPFSLSAWPRRGNGGTDFRPVFRALASEPPPLLIWFSDCQGRFPEHPPTYPVLWVVPPDAVGKEPPPFGRVIAQSSC